MAKLTKNFELMTTDKIDVVVSIDGVLESDQSIQLSQAKDVYSLSINGEEKPIYKAEYINILNLLKDESGSQQLVFKNKKEADAFHKLYFTNRDSDKFADIGALLYGSVWKKPLAIALKVDFRRITHWLQCTRPIPQGVWDDLLKICNQRQQEISDSMKIVKSKM